MVFCDLRFTTETMEKTSEYHSSLVLRICVLKIIHSANDVFNLEIAAGGTQFQATSGSMTAFSSLVSADEWMVFRNTLTNVLHWDYVWIIDIRVDPRQLLTLSCRVCSVVSSVFLSRIISTSLPICGFVCRF